MNTQPQSTIFQSLDRVLLDGESARFYITRKGNSFVVTYQPILGAAPDDLDAVGQEIRAKLSLPLQFSGTAEDMDASFASKMIVIGEARKEAADALASMTELLREAKKQATNHGNSTRAKMATAPAKPASTTPSSEDQNDDDATGCGDSTCGSDSQSPAVPEKPASAPAGFDDLTFD